MVWTKLLPEVVVCPRCNGYGDAECSDCEGSGRLAVTYRPFKATSFPAQKAGGRGAETPQTAMDKIA